jgi:integrase
MARSARSSRLESRTARLKLPPAKKPVFVRIAPGVALGYRRNQTAGTWVVRCADGAGGNWTKAFGIADDFEDASTGRTLTFWDAQAQARELAHTPQADATADAGKLATVRDALAAYEADLRIRNGDANNAARCLVHLPAALASKTVALLTAKELRRWRDGLLKSGLKPATVKRTAAALKAALTLAANEDPRIKNSKDWRFGLAAPEDADTARNVVISEADVLAIIRAAHEDSADFGLFVEAAAVTGARVSQLTRLTVEDLQGDRAAPRLMMPSSRKGRNKRIERNPVPIPASLAAKLKNNRPADAPLLLYRDHHRRSFARAVHRAGLDPSVTIYALRHTSIVRQLLAAVPIRVVASGHDTSVVMIEKNYSKYIGDHADTIVRRAILDPSAPTGDNVVPMVRS